MDSRNSNEIDLAAFSVFKRDRREIIKMEFPEYREYDIERRLNCEWANMTNKEKFPFIKIVEENPNITASSCQASSAHHTEN